jgi:hypothetical protein
VVLVAGLILHSILLVTVAVGFFSPAMFVPYLASSHRKPFGNCLHDSSTGEWQRRDQHCHAK